MRLIDADALKKQLLDYFTYSMQLCAEISDFIDNAPTIEPDSDTVIHCKDCRWRNDIGHWVGCPILNSDDDNYCSYAETEVN